MEEAHWWFKGRRRLFASVIQQLNLSSGSPILDLGTGTGANMRLFKQLGYSNVLGLDSNDLAIRFCAEKGLGDVKKGDICNLPFEENRFDLVLASDILEHVDDDLCALKEIKRVLLPGGCAIITVPAFQSLWGIQDEAGHHKRRYLLSDLRKKIGNVGLRCKDIFYFNYVLFFPIWLIRKAVKIMNIPLKNENRMNSRILNEILTFLFFLDVWTAERVKPLWGVSIYAMVQKG